MNNVQKLIIEYHFNYFEQANSEKQTKRKKIA